jgi:molybdopterin converting factor subunit 1
VASEPAIALNVRLFALIREKVGREAIALEVPAGSTVADLPAALRRAEPAVAPYLEASRIAVNLTFARPDHPLAPGDDVALIPPVGGG